MKTTILIIDDDQHFLKDCSDALEKEGYSCETCESAEAGYSKFEGRLYDGIICDILIPFRGERDGGLILAQEFSSKFPSSCMILVSQYVTAKLVNEFAGLPNHAFVEKGKNLTTDLICQIKRIVKTKSAFVCMPFDPAFTDIYELGIKPAVLKCGFKCVRADEIEHNRGILSVIYEQIQESHLVIADTTGRNPNVFYEIGFAHALKKEVVILAQRIDEVPIDLRGFNCVAYDGKITMLKEKLEKRLKTMLSKHSTRR